MGQNESAPAATEGAGKPGLNPDEVAQMTYGEFNFAIAHAISADDLAQFALLWQYIWPTRTEQHPKYDESLVGDNCMKHLKYSFRHENSSWREVGVRVCRTFFHLKDARDKLMRLDFMGSMMLLTMPEQGDDPHGDDGDGSADKEQAAKQAEFQVLAAETILEMADYPEFADALCATSVLNFLCIALNQVPRTVEIATSTFVKISSNPENLPVFLTGSVGDILESFFKSTNYLRPQDENKQEQWARDLSAMSSSAHTMGTIIKYGYPCQVDLQTVGDIFASRPDSVRLVAELARLFYWICRSSDDLAETLMESAGGSAEGLDTLLLSLAKIWESAVDVHNKLKLQTGGQPTDRTAAELQDFLVDDIDKSRIIEVTSEEFKDKVAYAEMRLCYMNCLLWVLLPQSHVRWRLRDVGLKNIHHAFELREQVLLQVILGTVRYLLDLPEVQDCSDLVLFFGEQLLICIDMAVQGTFPDSLLRVLLDGVCILSFQRGMQTMLADFNIWGKLNLLVLRWQERNADMDARRIQIAVLRVLSQVAVHPSHRLGWVAKGVDPTEVYPPRAEFEEELQKWERGTDESFKTMSSLLLTMFQERSFQKPPEQIEPTFLNIFDWWLTNSTSRYEEEKEAAEDPQADGGSQADETGRYTMSLKHKLAICIQRIQRVDEHRLLGSIQTLDYCAPYECVIALCLFSRLALEPKFKRLLSTTALEPLLGCVCTGIWAEAREAAATLANLMWVPDMDREYLVCWLKLDGSVTVDAANVLLPVGAGSPKPVDIGKAMYRSTWGIEFVKDSWVALHPNGLKTYNVPALLTTASPMDTFHTTSLSPYHWLDGPPDPRHFTITCWFYWPLRGGANGQEVQKCVLLQSSPPELLTQIYVDFETTDEGVWTVVDHSGKKHPRKTPRLRPGWHLLALVSSTSRSTAQPFHGTKLYLDAWSVKLENVWVLNDFYAVGNDAGEDSNTRGKCPFGTIADFRIYARCLAVDDIQGMATTDVTNNHPDKIAKQLANMDAATILAQRLDVPDSAAECLRALGSLATVASQRVKIFSVCGRQTLRLLHSPMPIIQRQAARLMNNTA